MPRSKQQRLRFAVARTATNGARTSALVGGASSAAESRDRQIGARKQMPILLPRLIPAIIATANCSSIWKRWEGCDERSQAEGRREMSLEIVGALAIGLWFGLIIGYAKGQSDAGRRRNIPKRAAGAHL